MGTSTRDRARLTALRADRLFDGGSTVIDRPTVVIDGGTIRSVGGPADVPDGARVVDLPGATLLPGLVDTHVHLAFDASMDPVARLAGRDDTAALDTMCAAARDAARGGVTTVRDLGDRGYLSLPLRDAAATDHTLPHIVAAGVPVTTPGGHCHFLGDCASGVDGVVAAVRRRAERGVDVIKVMASGGNMTPGSRPPVSQYDLAELRAIVETAHSLGLPVTAHAHGTRAIVDAVVAGVDSLEHVTFLNGESVDHIPEGLLPAIVDRGVALSLSLGMRQVPGVSLPPAMAVRMPLLEANARRMYAAGARIVVGTDAGIAPLKPHDALRYALPYLARVGMGPVEALHAVTGRAAELIGLGRRKGRLAAGFDADILAVDGDPLADPEAIHRIRAVYVRGTPLT